MSRPAQKSSHVLHDSQIDGVAQLFGVLSDPTRLKILHALAHRVQNVTQLMHETGLKQANISKHLSLLFQYGLVARRKSGTNVEYAISDERVFEICTLVCDCLRDSTKRQYDCLCAPRR